MPIRPFMYFCWNYSLVIHEGFLCIKRYFLAPTFNTDIPGSIHPAWMAQYSKRSLIYTEKLRMNQQDETFSLRSKPKPKRNFFLGRPVYSCSLRISHPDWCEKTWPSCQKNIGLCDNILLWIENWSIFC